jgi:hypothetical protein
MADLEQARAAKAHLARDLTGHDGIRGIGLTRVPEGYAVCVDVAERQEDLPGAVDGVPVRVRVVGPVHPQH